MKSKFILPILVAAMAAACVPGANAKVIETETVPSQILKMDRKYSVYLPPDYETSQRSYPILYLLHGSGDDHTGWVQFGEVERIANAAIADGTATAMVIVMPDADTGRRGYVNDPRGDWNYEDFFFKELMPHVEKKYRVRAEKRYRAVAGLSMGGGGSFVYALRHPDLFSSACPLSADAGPTSIEQTKEYMTHRMKGEFTEAQVEAFYQYRSSIRMIEKMPEEQKKAVRWYIDCGDDDFLYEGNSLVHIAMRKANIPHEFRISDGGHNWTYWRQSLPHVLSFISDAFHQY